jgi:hypothetical protein
VSLTNTLENTKADKQLLGKWVKTDEPTSKDYLLFQENDKNSLNLLISDKNDENPASTVSSVQIGNYWYMILKLSNKSEDEEIIVVARYKISKNILTVWLLDENKIKTEVSTGKLKGKIEGMDVQINESPKDLANYLQASETLDKFELLGSFKKSN